MRIIEPDGRVCDDVDPPTIDDDILLEIYEGMRLARHFDQRAVNLQRQGRMGTYPPLAGQEAAQVASAVATDAADWAVPSYREHAVGMVRGMALSDILLYWMGHEQGNRAAPAYNQFTIGIPIATQLPHAVGLAWAAALRDDSLAVITYFGDGATSEGDFHEAMNFAGVFDTPTVFFCNNNQWAISVPRERQTASETLAQKADAYGFEGIVVDGMDPLAVYQVTRDALDRARTPDGDQPRPTMIEAVQYRFGAHTTADDPSVYRSSEEVERWRDRDPIPRFETFLRERGLLDDQAIERIDEAVQEEVSDAIDAAESSPRPMPDEMFEWVYDELPPRLLDQREWMAAFRDEHGDDTILERGHE